MIPTPIPGIYFQEGPFIFFPRYSGNARPSVRPAVQFFFLGSPVSSPCRLEFFLGRVGCMLGAVAKDSSFVRAVSVMSCRLREQSRAIFFLIELFLPPSRRRRIQNSATRINNMALSPQGLSENSGAQFPTTAATQKLL